MSDSTPGICQRLFYSFCKTVSLLTASLLFNTRVYGARKAPRRGPCLIASTHQSFLDPWIVGMSVRRRCSYLARASLIRLPIFGRLLRCLGTVPIPRDSAASRGALDAGIRLLRNGEALLVFPEGTRSADGRLQPLKRGAALLARRTSAPVVPVLVIGTWAIWPRDRRAPRLRFPWLTLPRWFHRRGDGFGGGRDAFGASARRAAIRIFFGEPLHFEHSEDLDTFTARLRDAYDELARHAGVPELSGAGPGARNADECTSETIGGGRTERPRSFSTMAAGASAAGSGTCSDPTSPGIRGDALNPRETPASIAARVASGRKESTSECPPTPY